MPDFESTPEANISSQEGSPLVHTPDSDVVDRGVVSLEGAYQLFRSYNENIVQHYPGVVFAAEFTGEECRRTKPTLFLAVIAAAAGQKDPHLYSVLSVEVLKVHAIRMVMRHEKSLELAQALIVSSVWYRPPGSYGQLKFYEYIHMAATMAIDIGLGKNPKDSRSRRGIGGKIEAEVLSSADIENRGTFLVCYLMATSVSMSMRRPNMLRYSSWVRECLDTIISNPEISELDQSLVGWVKLLKITEDIGISFKFDDPGNMPDLPDRAQIMVGDFEKELEDWKKEFDDNGMNDALLLQYCHTQMYLHEVALHDDHLPEDFIPPMKLTKVISIHTIQGVSSSFLGASAMSIMSTHTLLDTILDMEISTLRALPIVNFVRVCYALITLIKLYISAKSPSGKIGSVLDSKSLRLDYYLKAITDKLIEAVGPEQFRAPYAFLGLIMRFHVWYERQKPDKYFQPPTGLQQPRDECFFPPLAKIEWESYFGKLHIGPTSVAHETDWSWDILGHEHSKSHLSVVNMNGSTNLADANSINFDLENANYDYLGNEFDLNEMMLNHLQYDTALDDFAPNSELLYVYDSLALSIFQHESEGKGE